METPMDGGGGDGVISRPLNGEMDQTLFTDAEMEEG
jgi:hypothetical protein